MTDHATPNLPSRNFDVTKEFYAALGFGSDWHDNGWMILERGQAMLEFFPYPDLDPATSSFSCCLRLDDLNALYAVCVAAGIHETTTGWPRLHPPALDHSGMTIAYLVDSDGNLLRLVQNI